MAQQIRVRITRRSGAPLAGARCTLDRADEPPACAPVVTDAQGYAVFTIDTPAPATLRIVASPPAPRAALAASPPWEQNDTALWPVTVDLALDASNVLAWSNRPAEAVRLDAGAGTTELEVRLLRVRNMDAIARTVLARYVTFGATIDYPPAAPPAGGPLPFSYTTSPLLGGDGKIARVSADRPAGDARRASLLEVAARKAPGGHEEPAFAPKCVGVYLPDEVTAMDAPPLLFYFRPTADQDFNGRWSGFDNLPNDTVTNASYTIEREGAAPYDRAGYHFEWFFRRTFEHVTDPWARTGAYAAGLIDQIQAARKVVGVIAPVPEATLPNGGFGHTATDLAFMYELCAEILELAELASFAARGAPSPRPGRAPGRMAAAGFSSGNLTLQSFVRAVMHAGAASPLGARLREVYSLDAPSSFAAVVDDGALFLRSLADPSSGALRVYAQTDYARGPHFADLQKALAPAANAPADLTSERAPEPRPGPPHRTAAFLPPAAWPAEGAQFGDIHSFVPATMLCHALRLSGFSDR